MDTLKIKDKDYPFSFSMLAQREMLKTDISKKDDFELTIYFVWLGLKYGAIRNNKKFELTEKELSFMFDDDYEAWNRAGELLGERLALMNRMRNQEKK